MTGFWRLSGTTFRLPGLTFADRQTEEYIHRSVYQLTFPCAPRTSMQEPSPSPCTLPPVFAPCESLKGVSPLDAMGPSLTASGPRFWRVWAPRYVSNWFWPYKIEGRQLALGQVVPEMDSLSNESALTTRWVMNTHLAAGKGAKAGDEEENPLFTALLDTYNLPSSQLI